MLIISQPSVTACSTAYFLLIFVGHVVLLLIQSMQVTAIVLPTKEGSEHSLLIPF